MKVKKIPLRSCVVTKERLPKKDLLRIVRMPDGRVFVDEVGKVNGRGAYIKRDMEVLKKARKSRILEKRLECSIDEDIYEEIINVIHNKKE